MDTGMVTVNKQSNLNSSAVFYIIGRTDLDNQSYFADGIAVPKINEPFSV
jgi:hypothetical protein